MQQLRQQLTNRIPAPFRNRYVLVLLAFVTYMVFFDRHDPLTQFQLQRMVRQLESDRVYYLEKIAEEEREMADMQANQERFARERYFMQRANEDVFIIVDESAE
jgi:cell division protein DivIC